MSALHMTATAVGTPTPPRLKRKRVAPAGRTPELHLAAARLAAGRLAPYFRSYLLFLVPVFTDRVPTMGVTRFGVMLVNPEFLLALDEEEAAAVLLHEVEHFRRKHGDRAATLGVYAADEGGETPAEDVGLDLPAIWNIAGDAAINPHLLKMGAQLPSNPDAKEQPSYVMPARFGLPDNETAEWYYRALCEKAREKNEELKKFLDDLAANLPAHGSCGGCAGHVKSPEIEAEFDKRHGRSPTEAARVHRQVAEAVRSHVAKHGPGAVPSDTREWAEAVLGPPVIRWQTKLATWVRATAGRIRAGRADYSFARPARRTYARGDGMVRPGLMDRLPEVAFVFDTSASVSKRALGLALREATSVLLTLGLDSAWMVEVDADVARKPRRVALRDLRRYEFSGRGGTDFRPGFKAASTLRPAPALTFYFTDGEGCAPTVEPKWTRTCWVIVNDNEETRPFTEEGWDKPCEWGFIVRVPETDPHAKPATQEDDDA